MKKRMKNSGYGAGMSFPYMVTVVFIILKLAGVIDWEWAWVFSPTWITLALTALVVLAVMVMDGVN